MKREIEIAGLNKLVRDLSKLDESLPNRLKELNLELARDVTNTAASRAPVLTGRLRASVRAGATKRSGTIKAGKKAIPYAGPIHFGWRRRNIRPNPFMWEALDKRRSEIEGRYLKELNNITKKAF